MKHGLNSLACGLASQPGHNHWALYQNPLLLQPALTTAVARGGGDSPAGGRPSLPHRGHHLQRPLPLLSFLFCFSVHNSKEATLLPWSLPFILGRMSLVCLLTGSSFTYLEFGRRGESSEQSSERPTKRSLGAGFGLSPFL